jgi:bacterioferritin
MLKLSNAQTTTGGRFVKGNEKLIPVLNQLLADELSAISQYMVHAEMCENWGFGGLHAAIEKQAMDEMHHAEWLIARILFLQGKPVVSKLNPIVIGDLGLGHDHERPGGRVGGGKGYNAGDRARLKSGTSQPLTCSPKSSRRRRAMSTGPSSSEPRSTRWGWRTI